MLEWHCHCPQGDPPIKFYVFVFISYVSCFSLLYRDTLSTRVLFVRALTVHPVTGNTRAPLQYHVSCCSSRVLCLWFSRVMSVLVIHLRAVSTAYTSAIFTTMSVCSLQCWLHFDYWLLYLLTSTHIILPGRSDEIYPCRLRATYGNRF